ncbi:hypothetical protein DERP_004924 [Dermatophagoides pteronyssinus]|uniref:Uncharacterized protein n=1 Tax=Dermatophagoides pteronyssinus TaxID=6956 RepID=A0ABQ8JSW4_DERPT|nr:hypothetical protein DERP_004924 [Dermatophagoides pteronyssinus]
MKPFVAFILMDDQMKTISKCIPDLLEQQQASKIFKKTIDTIGSNETHEHQFRYFPHVCRRLDYSNSIHQRMLIILRSKSNFKFYYHLSIEHNAQPVRLIDSNLQVVIPNITSAIKKTTWSDIILHGPNNVL